MSAKFVVFIFPIVAFSDRAIDKYGIRIVNFFQATANHWFTNHTIRTPTLAIFIFITTYLYKYLFQYLKSKEKYGT